MGNAPHALFWRRRSRATVLRAWASGIVLLGLVGISPCVADAASATQEEGGVQLDAAVVSRLGIQTASVEATKYRRAITGYGAVIGLETLAQVDADLMTAEAATKASGDALTRAHKLFQNRVTTQSLVDAAENQAAADAAQLALAQRKAIVVYGARAPWQTPQARAAAMAELTAGRAVLVRATFPVGRMTATPSALDIARPLRDPSGAVWTTTAVWDAPADSSIPGRSFFALVRDSDLAQGERVVVTALQGDPIAGVVVQATAIVVSEGATWCYVMVAPNSFARRLVDTGMPTTDGYFVARGIAPGESVVTVGAGLLLAREMNPASASGD